MSSILPPYILKAIEVAYLKFRKADASGQIRMRVDRGKVEKVWVKMDTLDMVWENKGESSEQN